ncbi:MAG: hypothetical protein FWE69_07840 [Clostridiales bacterium]|nr:hypothetical protein [Clostridiales bacterium]
MDLLFTVALGAIALYVLVSAIRGKGRLFQADSIKEKYKDKYVKVLRIIYLVLGLFMVFNSAASGLNNILYEEKIELTADYEDPLGVVHMAGTQFDRQELWDIVSATPDSAEPEAAPEEDPEAKEPVNINDIIIQVFVRKEGMEETLPFLSRRLLDGLTTWFMIASLVPLVAVFVAINIMTDKEKRKEAQAKAKGNSLRMPSGAFEFDEDDS